LQPFGGFDRLPVLVFSPSLSDSPLASLRRSKTTAAVSLDSRLRGNDRGEMLAMTEKKTIAMTDGEYRSRRHSLFCSLCPRWEMCVKKKRNYSSKRFFDNVEL